MSISLPDHGFSPPYTHKLLLIDLVLRVRQKIYSKGTDNASVSYYSLIFT